MGLGWGVFPRFGGTIVDGAYLTAYLSDAFGKAAWSAYETLHDAALEDDPAPMGRAFVEAMNAAMKAVEAFAKVCDAEYGEAQYTLQGGQ
jgi:hypothetical protein